MSFLASTLAHGGGSGSGVASTNLAEIRRISSIRAKEDAILKDWMQRILLDGLLQHGAQLLLLGCIHARNDQLERSLSLSCIV